MSAIGGSPRGGGRSITWKGRTSAAVLACAALALGAALPADAATSGVSSKPSADKAPGKTKDDKPKKDKGAAVGSTAWGDVSAAAAAHAVTPAGEWAANLDRGSMYSIITGYGMRAAWAGGVTGKGVTVAVIDTGIAPVAGLDASGKIVNGPDLSFDSQRPGTRYVDGVRPRHAHGRHHRGPRQAAEHQEAQRGVLRSASHPTRSC